MQYKGIWLSFILITLSCVKMNASHQSGGGASLKELLLLNDLQREEREQRYHIQEEQQSNFCMLEISLGSGMFELQLKSIANKKEEFQRDSQLLNVHIAQFLRNLSAQGANLAPIPGQEGGVSVASLRDVKNENIAN